MSGTYLTERDLKYINKSRKLLSEMPDYVKQFYDAKKGAKKELTRYAYLLDIRDFLSYLSPFFHKKEISFEDLGELTVQDIDEYKNYLFLSYSPSSVKRKLASLSSFFKFMVLSGYIENNPAAIIDWPSEDKDKNIIFLDDEQTEKLLNGIRANNKQLNEENEVIPISEISRNRREKVKERNYLIISLFLKTGIRISELVSIDLEDISWRDTILLITGKGGKTRPVGFGEDFIIGSMKRYITTERRFLLGKNRNEKALFVSRNGKRLSVRQIETMVKEMVLTYLSDDPFLDLTKFSPHKLRSSCATRLLAATGDIKGVSDLLGHDSVEITARRYAALNQLNNAKKMQEIKVQK